MQNNIQARMVPKIQRLFQNVEIRSLIDGSVALDEWKMNLMAISEEYNLLILGVESKVVVFEFDYKQLMYSQATP